MSSLNLLVNFENQVLQYEGEIPQSRQISNPAKKRALKAGFEKSGGIKKYTGGIVKKGGIMWAGL